jgi:hypothetical protein
VENIGSLFFIILAYPFAILVCFLLKKLLVKYVNDRRYGRRVISGLDSLIKSAFWNFPISSLFESYLIICLVSLIGLKGLVFTGN